MIMRKVFLTQYFLLTGSYTVLIIQRYTYSI